MKFTLITLALFATLLPYEAVSKETESRFKVTPAEERFLDLVSTLPYTTTYEELQKVVPELGPLKDQGYDNSQAMFETRLFGLRASMHFSFHKRVLVSCGAAVEDLDRVQALAIYTAARNYLRSRFGKGKEEEGYSNDDPNPDYGCFCNWTVNDIVFGTSWKRHGRYRAGWGAQAAPKSKTVNPESSNRTMQRTATRCAMTNT
ncbi:MAG: hypothetical protein QOJ45_1633 [Verrucomicrobiota bacterium]|jgi:hypothetical protein